MASNRDNFSVPVIRKLRERVATRCSNPNCRVSTFAPSGEDGVSNIGIAAHIHAASKGGPRYDENMSIEERKSIKNAIWLCSNCSIKIDRDIEKYPVTLLHRWKVEAEKTTLEEQGQKLPTKNDAINTLTAALTGVSKSILSQSISNVHEANSKVLEALDPRFSIKSQYIDGCSLIQLYPKENIPFTMDIKPEGRKDFISKHKDLVEHGRELIVSTSLFDVRGSKLIEHITDSLENGNMTISPKKIPSLQRLWLVNKESNAHTYLEDIHGYIVLGTKSFEFNGTALSGILNYKHTSSFDGNSGQSNLNLNFTEWEGKSINKLKYFDKLFDFFEEMFKGSKFLSCLEVDGGKGLNGTFENPESIDSFQYIYNHLQYLKYSREIASFLDIDMKYTSNVTYTYEYLLYVSEIYEIIKGLSKWSAKDQKNNAKTTFCVRNAKELQTEIMRADPCEIKIIAQEREDVELFGEHLTLPIKVFLIQNVIPKILGETNKPIKDGDLINVEYVPSANYSCSIFYEKAL